MRASLCSSEQPVTATTSPPPSRTRVNLDTQVCSYSFVLPIHTCSQVLETCYRVAGQFNTTGVCVCVCENMCLKTCACVCFKKGVEGGWLRPSGAAVLGYRGLCRVWPHMDGLGRCTWVPSRAPSPPPAAPPPTPHPAPPNPLPNPTFNTPAGVNSLGAGPGFIRVENPKIINPETLNTSAGVNSLALAQELAPVLLWRLQVGAAQKCRCMYFFVWIKPRFGSDYLDSVCARDSVVWLWRLQVGAAHKVCRFVYVSCVCMAERLCL
jgi:hypothetical protein